MLYIVSDVSMSRWWHKMLLLSYSDSSWFVLNIFPAKFRLRHYFFDLCYNSWRSARFFLVLGIFRKLEKNTVFLPQFHQNLLSRTSLESDWKTAQLKLHDAALYHIAKVNINIFNNDSVYLISRMFVWRATQRIPNFCFTQLFTKKAIVYNISHSNSRTSLSTEDWNPDSSNIW